MSKMKNTLLILSLFCLPLFAQEERKVLAEVFTNSHCPLCPPAHNVIESYLNGPNGDRISFIFYHMFYPYNDDPLYWQSQEGSDARDNFYNPVSATPQGWFDGVHQGSTSGWAANLDNQITILSPLKISLSGSKTPNLFNINAELTRTGNISDNDLVIHFVVVEDLFFDGRNTISNHKQVMRKMFPTPAGHSFSIDLNETINIPQTIELDPIWDSDSLSVVVFIQSTGSKTVYQSETISYNNLVVTVEDDPELRTKEFILEQNYPNPFNPRTIIGFQTTDYRFISLKVYDLMGREVTTLVDEYKPAGRYEVAFDASHLSNGVYFYRLQADEFTSTKKLILMK